MCTLKRWKYICDFKNPSLSALKQTNKAETVVRTWRKQIAQVRCRRRRFAADRSKWRRRKCAGRTCWSWWGTATQCSAGQWLAGVLEPPTTCWLRELQFHVRTQAGRNTQTNTYDTYDTHRSLAIMHYLYILNAMRCPYVTYVRL